MDEQPTRCRDCDWWRWDAEMQQDDCAAPPDWACALDDYEGVLRANQARAEAYEQRAREQLTRRWLRDRGYDPRTGRMMTKDARKGSADNE